MRVFHVQGCGPHRPGMEAPVGVARADAGPRSASSLFGHGLPIRKQSGILQRAGHRSDSPMSMSQTRTQYVLSKNINNL